MATKSKILFRCLPYTRQFQHEVGLHREFAPCYAPAVSNCLFFLSSLVPGEYAFQYRVSYLSFSLPAFFLFASPTLTLFASITAFCAYRVGRGPLGPFPPSEPYMTVSRHTAQAFQRQHLAFVPPSRNLVTNSLTIRMVIALSAYNPCSANPVTAFAIRISRP